MASLCWNRSLAGKRSFNRSRGRRRRSRKLTLMWAAIAGVDRVSAPARCLDEADPALRGVVPRVERGSVEENASARSLTGADWVAYIDAVRRRRTSVLCRAVGAIRLLQSAPRWWRSAEWTGLGTYRVMARVGICFGTSVPRHLHRLEWKGYVGGARAGSRMYFLSASMGEWVKHLVSVIG